MKHWMLLTIVMASLQIASATPDNKSVLEEILYQDIKATLKTKDQNKILMKSGFTSFEQKLFVDAVEDMAFEGDTFAINSFNKMNLFNFELSERLRIGILRIKYNRAINLPEDLVLELIAKLAAPEVETKIIYLLAAFEDELMKAGHSDIIESAKKHPQYFDIILDQERREEITQDMIADLFHKTPDVSTYMNGEYVKSVKIFIFCRNNRLFPCLMVMRNIHGEVVRNKDGSIWTQKALASSSRGLPSYTRNGNTPAGILTIDSVMPFADQQISFGKFRRMIINFIPKSKDESLVKSLLPSSSHDQTWWRPALIAREVGRNLFRIHGTGKINKDPTTPYYPFMRTSGCIAQLENSYDGVTYKDQRELLDAVMIAMNLEPNYANEVNVKGILYLVDIDDTNASVEASDLAIRGIE